MRFILLTLLLGFSSLADAQIFGGDDLRDARDCLDSFDRDELKDFGDDAREVVDEIQDLCDDDEDEDARDVASDYIDKLADSEELQELEECSEVIRDTMPSVWVEDFPSAESMEEELDDICDFID
ncbi:MAG: hypothetical protein GQ538_01960 [Xanthomonadales bacterium]|nr:hypothetical protein [Xanthomonadales bacterium]